MLKKLWRDSGGATAIEYGLIAALVTIVVIGAFVTICPTGSECRGLLPDTQQIKDSATTTGTAQ